MGLKQARSWFRFPAWVQFFVSGVTCSARRAFGVTRVAWLELSRDVIGKALLSNPLTSWLRYGFGTVLRPPPMVGFVERVQRAGFQVSLARVWARRVQERPRVARGKRRERRRGRASSFQLSGLDAAHRRLIESDCPYGAELHPCPWFSCKAFSMEKRITFDPCIKLLSSLHIYNITTFVIVLIHEVLQPFIKV